MTSGIQELELILQDDSINQLKNIVQRFFDEVLDVANGVELPIAPTNGGMENDVMVAQLIVGVIALLIVGVTFLPFGATPATIKACQLNTDQKLLKYLGVAIAITTSFSAILYLEVLKLYGIIGTL